MSPGKDGGAVGAAEKAARGVNEDAVAAVSVPAGKSVSSGSRPPTTGEARPGPAMAGGRSSSNGRAAGSVKKRAPDHDPVCVEKAHDAGKMAGHPADEESIRTVSCSKHGKELLASHELPRPVIVSKSYKPWIAAVLLLATAIGGYYFSGALVAAPLSPWVTGESGDIFGQVKGPGDAVLANATVAVGDIEETTNETGWFELRGIPTGNRVIVVDCPGYRQLRYSTFIGGGNPMRYSLALSAGNGTEARDDVTSQVQGFYTCGTVTILFSTIVLLGALFAFMRKGYAVCTTGALLGMGILPLFPVGTVTCLVSLVVLLFSRGEFS